MPQDFSPFLRIQRLANFSLAFFLALLELPLIGLFVVFVYAWHKNPSGALATVMVVMAFLLVLNTMALAWAIRNYHFIVAYGHWPRHPSPAGTDSRLWPAARDAFFEGDYGRSLALLKRMEENGMEAPVRLAMGRVLVWLGRLEEGAAEIEVSGLDQRGLYWIRRQRRWGRETRTYFTSGDHEKVVRLGGPLTLVALLLCGMAFGLYKVWDSNRQGKPLLALKYFDPNGFKTQTLGIFTIHYHDEEFRDLTVDLADRALAHHLAYLELAPDTFGLGQIQLYLCDDRKEYGQRAPAAPKWEDAAANAKEKTIYLYRHPPKQKIYYEVVLAHELSHLCLAKIIPDRSDLNWLNEGLADYLGYRFALDRAGFARQAWLKEHNFKGLGAQHLPFDTFFTINPRTLEDDAKVDLFYRQGFSVVSMLAEHYGEKSLNRFMRNYGTNPDMNRALKSAYGSLDSVESLSAIWGLFYRDENSSK